MPTLVDVLGILRQEILLFANIHGILVGSLPYLPSLFDTVASSETQIGTELCNKSGGAVTSGLSMPYGIEIPAESPPSLE
jgi:hypothetical protein